MSKAAPHTKCAFCCFFWAVSHSATNMPNSVLKGKVAQTQRDLQITQYTRTCLLHTVCVDVYRFEYGTKTIHWTVPPPPPPKNKQTKKQKEKKHAKYKHQRLQLFSVPFICCHYETFFRTDYSSFHEKWKKKELMWFFCKTSVFCVRHYTYLFVCFGTFYRLGHKNLGHYHLCNWTN